MQYCIYPLFLQKIVLTCDQNPRENSSLMPEFIKYRRKSAEKTDNTFAADFNQSASINPTIPCDTNCDAQKTWEQVFFISAQLCQNYKAFTIY